MLTKLEFKFELKINLFFINSIFRNTTLVEGWHNIVIET